MLWSGLLIQFHTPYDIEDPLFSFSSCCYISEKHMHISS